MTNTKLYLVNVQKKCNWGRRSFKGMDNLLRTAKGLDVELLTFFSDSPIAILKDCIEKNNVRHIVFGSHDESSLVIAEQLDLRDEDLEVHICKHL